MSISMADDEMPKYILYQNKFLEGHRESLPKNKWPSLTIPFVFPHSRQKREQKMFLQQQPPVQFWYSPKSFWYYRPKVFEDSRLIADAIKENKIVTFSLEFLEYEVGQRVIDFVSGAAYAMSAHLSKVTDKVLTSIPMEIDYEDIDASLGEDEGDGTYL